MRRVRYAAINALDWLDHYVLGHRSYAVCCWVAEHSWWRALCGRGCRAYARGFCVSCGCRAGDDRG